MLETIFFCNRSSLLQEAHPSRWLISFAAVVLLPGYSEMLGSVSRWRCLFWRDLFPYHYRVIVSLFCCSLREEGAFLLCADGPSESSQAVGSTASSRFLTVNKCTKHSTPSAKYVHYTVAGLQLTMHSLSPCCCWPPAAFLQCTPRHIILRC